VDVSISLQIGPRVTSNCPNDNDRHQHQHSMLASRSRVRMVFLASTTEARRPALNSPGLFIGMFNSNQSTRAAYLCTFDFPANRSWTGPKLPDSTKLVWLRLATYSLHPIQLCTAPARMPPSLTTDLSTTESRLSKLKILDLHHNRKSPFLHTVSGF
jgi:hypothetical protein